MATASVASWHEHFIGRNLRRRHREKLLGFSGICERRGGSKTSGNNLRHQIEISGADKSLVLHAFISVLLARKFSFLQGRVRLHSTLFVGTRQVEHAQVQRMEPS